jgi:hypothetical protein
MGIVVSHIAVCVALYPRTDDLNILTISYSSYYLQIVSRCFLNLLNVTLQTSVFAGPKFKMNTFAFV